jgi:hypothetical protein
MLLPFWLISSRKVIFFFFGFPDYPGGAWMTEEGGGGPGGGGAGPGGGGADIGGGPPHI